MRIFPTPGCTDQPGEGVEWHPPATEGCIADIQSAGTGGTRMAKGQVKKEKTNKPKLSPKEKKANKAAKKAAKAGK